MANKKSSSGTGQTLVDFTVPAKFWQPLRAGVVADLAWEATTTHEQFEKGFQHRLYGYDERVRGFQDLDEEGHTGKLRYMAQTAALLVAMEEACPAAEKPHGDTKISADPEALQFALQALAQKHSGPLSVLALDFSPPNPETYEGWQSVTAWAMKEAVALQEPMGKNLAARVLDMAGEES